ncbi:MAG TPA: branched-chain amino acid ABC transporter permease [Tepidisphaeraceae bacterium]|nr:branched-chain amino acid ABC transporter permease [Tepidisphaeraceae bacterium]
MTSSTTTLQEDFPLPPQRSGKSFWFYTLRTNALVLALLALLVPISWYAENPDRLDPYYARILMLIGINVVLAVSLQLINGISGQFSLGHAGFMAVGAYMAGYPATAYSNELHDPGAVLLFYVALFVTLGTIGLLLWGLFALLRLSRRAYGGAPLLLLLALLAWFVWDISMAARVTTGQGAPPYLVWSRLIVWIQSGFTWILERGTPAAAWVDGHLPEAGRKPVTFLLLLLGGACCAAVAGFLIGLPTLRLRGDYLAIATLGFSEIIRVVITNAEPLGRATGLSVPVYSNVGSGESPEFRIFPWVFGAALVTTMTIWRLQHSAKGRAIAAVREDEIAAAAVGIDTTHHKVLAFVIGAFFAGVAGGLFAHYDGYLNPNAFGFIRSIEVVVMVTIGGLGSVWGAIAAAAVLTWLPEFLRDPGSWIGIVTSAELPRWLVDSLAAVGENRMVAYSLLLILIMLARGGAFGFRRPSFLRWRREPGAPAAGATAS